MIFALKTNRKITHTFTDSRFKTAVCFFFYLVKNFSLKIKEQRSTCKNADAFRKGRMNIFQIYLSSTMEIINFSYAQVFSF